MILQVYLFLTSRIYLGMANLAMVIVYNAVFHALTHPYRQVSLGEVNIAYFQIGYLGTP